MLPLTTHLQKVPSQDLTIGSSVFPTKSMEKCFERWVLTLLSCSTQLTSLSIDGDGVSWRPDLSFLALRHLKLNMLSLKPHLAVLADLPSCQCLESLTISAHEGDRYASTYAGHRDLPDMNLHTNSCLKSVQVLEWYPMGEFTLPPGCMLRFMIALKTNTQWLRWRRKGCPTSMLDLECNELRAWPAGISTMSELHYLQLRCIRLQGQDLATLQHIPHVSLEFSDFTALVLTSGSWHSLRIMGEKGFNVNFSNADAYVRGTKRFLFECPSQNAGEMYKGLRAAYVRQWVACYECEHVTVKYVQTKYVEKPKVAYLSNVKLCKAPQQTEASTWEAHESLIDTDDVGWLT